MGVCFNRYLKIASSLVCFPLKFIRVKVVVFDCNLLSDICIKDKTRKVLSSQTYCGGFSLRRDEVQSVSANKSL